MLATSRRRVKDPTYGQLVLFRQLVHTQDSNDILERLVVLEDLLDGGGNIVVLLANDTGVQHTGLGVEGVDGGVDTQLSDGTRQHSCGVQVSEGGGGSRISQIVSRDVDSLDGGNGTLLGGGDTLLPVQDVRE
jgi:hypothetical protein